MPEEVNWREIHKVIILCWLTLLRLYININITATVRTGTFSYKNYATQTWGKWASCSIVNAFVCFLIRIKNMYTILISSASPSFNILGMGRIKEKF